MKYLYTLESAPEKKSLTGISAGTPWRDALQAPSPPAVSVLLFISWYRDTYFPPEGEVHSARAKQDCSTCEVPQKLTVLD